MIADVKECVFLGYRKDRLGGRLIALVNALRLGRTYGAPAKYWWLADSEGEDQTITDPAAIFAPDFIAENLIVSPNPPRMQGRTDFDHVEGSTAKPGLRRALDAGEKYIVGALKINKLNDEDPEQVQSDLKAVFASLKFTDRIQSRLDAALKTIRESDQNIHAMHVRRGDLLHRDPWCRAAWTSKFVPDEFFLETAKDGPFIGFTDTPEALERLSSQQPNIIPVTRLVDFTGLSPVERDVVELLIMAHCESISAAYLSAFSTTAALMSGKPARGLPRALPTPRRDQAYDALIARCINDPASFLAPGDLAQSIVFGFRRAIDIGRHAELDTMLQQRTGMLAKFPFLYPVAASLALASNDVARAAQLSRDADGAKHIWPRDAEHCRALGLVAMAELGRHDPKTQSQTAEFAFDHILDRKSCNSALDGPVAYFLKELPDLSKAFLFDKTLLTSMSPDTGAELRPVPDGGDSLEERLSDMVPLWVLAADWMAIFKGRNFANRTVNTPSYFKKRRAFPAELRALEEAIIDDRAGIPDDADMQGMLGLMASVHVMHGKLKRGQKLLGLLNAAKPGDALTNLRRHNALLAAGQNLMAVEALETAIKAAPDVAVLHWILGRHELAEGRLGRAMRHWVQATKCAVCLPEVYEDLFDVVRQRNDQQAKRQIILAAHKRYPRHARFEKRAQKL